MGKQGQKRSQRKKQASRKGPQYNYVCRKCGKGFKRRPLRCPRCGSFAIESL